MQEETGPWMHPYATELHGTMGPTGRLRALIIDGEWRRIKDLTPRYDQGPDPVQISHLFTYHEAYLDDGRHAMLACDAQDRSWWLLAIAPGTIAIPDHVNVREGF